VEFKSPQGARKPTAPQICDPIKPTDAPGAPERGKTMPHSDDTLNNVLHRLNLIEGALDRELEQTELSVTRRKNCLAVIRQVIAVVHAWAREHPQADSHRNSHRREGFPPGLVARKLKIGQCSDSSLWFEIDESGDWFALPARLAGLLKFLVSESETDPGENNLLGFHARTSVLAYLIDSGGREYKPSFVHKMLNKLREKLHDHDPRNLVESRKQGVRLLVRKGGVEFVQLDKAPIQPTLRPPRNGLLHMPKKPVQSIEGLGTRTSDRTNWKIRDSRDQG
jgi:hypothetical protein